MQAQMGMASGEVGFTWSTSGKASRMYSSKLTPDRNGHLSLPMAADTFAAVHSHCRGTVGSPSPDDVAAARNGHLNVYVISGSGLWLVSPDSSITHVLEDHGWMLRR
jgi:hypothetical protein